MKVILHLIALLQFTVLAAASASPALGKQINNVKNARAEIALLVLTRPINRRCPRTAWIVTNEYIDEQLARQILHVQTFNMIPGLSRIPLYCRENMVNTGRRWLLGGTDFETVDGEVTLDLIRQFYGPPKNMPGTKYRMRGRSLFGEVSARLVQDLYSTPPPIMPHIFRHDASHVFLNFESGRNSVSWPETIYNWGLNCLESEVFAVEECLWYPSALNKAKIEPYEWRDVDMPDSSSIED